MRLVLFSDTHGMHEDVIIPDGDVLIHAGDFSGEGSIQEQQAFDQFLGSLPHRHKIVIAGNHDWQMEQYAKTQPVFHHAEYLQDSSVEIDGIRFYGAPWQPQFYDWAFNLPRGEALAEKWSTIPANTDVLITHCPPQGVLDKIYDGTAVGCEALAETIERVQPRLHVFGHIHEDYGSCKIGNTTFVNACSCTFRYQPLNPCVLFDL